MWVMTTQEVKRKVASVKTMFPYLKKLRKRGEMSLICCEPGVSSLKPQNWPPIIPYDNLIRQMIHTTDNDSVVLNNNYIPLGQIMINY